MKNEITLEDVLACRERRAKLQQKLLETYHRPLISFTMNIAGPIKTSALIRRAFSFGLRMIEDRFDSTSILFKEITEANTGYQAIYVLSEDARHIKNICVSIEESTSVGRLFDMDVIDSDNTKLDRSTTRGCIVCGAPGRSCAAARSHSVEELQAKTSEIIETFFREQDAKTVEALAYACLIDEVHTTPKPGLVDLSNTGSHTDMDVNTFVASANALRPYFKNCFWIGCQTAAESEAYTFQKLKAAGILAEEDMLRATGGVNTHKGMVYSLGILCGAIGRLWAASLPFADTTEILNQASRLARDAVHADFQNPDGKTAGSRLYIEQKITGIRGEAANGFPNVENIALPAFQNALHRKMNRNDAGILALLHLIANVEDTNLYHRGGKEGADYAKDYAKKLLSLDRMPTKAELLEMDSEFIKRNLSPGGCADLLAITYFVESLSKVSV